MFEYDTWLSWLQEALFPWLVSTGISILLIIVGAFLVKRFGKLFVVRLVRKAIPASSFLTSDAERKRENTLIEILTGALGVLVWLVSGLMILAELDINIGPLLAGAGIAGVALGFGAQYLVRDIINGVFIVFENQFRVGDVVQFGAVSGTVEDISLRTTTLRDLDGIVHYVPNGEITIASNMTKDFSRINLDISIAYEADLDEAIKVIDKVGEDFAKDGEWKDKIKEAPKFLRVNDLSDSAIVLKILGETEPLQQWAVTGELRRRLKTAFDRAGIDIPYPQQVVRHVREDSSQSS